jgi:hypothetical protein
MYHERKRERTPNLGRTMLLWPTWRKCLAAATDAPSALFCGAVQSERPAAKSGRTAISLGTAIYTFPPFQKTHVFRNGLRRIEDVVV